MRRFAPASRGRTAHALCLALLLGASSGLGCSSDAPPAPQREPAARANLDGVIYETGTTDEGLLTLLDAEPVPEVRAEPVVTAPAEGASVTTSATFSYTLTSAARSTTRARRTPAWSFSDWFVLERSAFAHGAPMNGHAFFLVFATPQAPQLLRVFTQATSYAPSAEAWEKLALATGPISLTVTRAFFEEGRLTADGGPYVGAPVHFTVTR